MFSPFHVSFLFDRLFFFFGTHKEQFRRWNGTLSPRKIMSLENPFDKMKSREEREREKKKEVFSRGSWITLNDLQKRSSKISRILNSPKLWKLISFRNYDRVKFRIFLLTRVSLIFANRTIISLEILSFRKRSIFSVILVNNFSYWSACSHFTNQRNSLLFLLLSSSSSTRNAFSIKIIYRPREIFNFPSQTLINVRYL